MSDNDLSLSEKVSEMKKQLTSDELDEFFTLAKDVPFELKEATAWIGQIKLTQMERGLPVKPPENMSRFHELSWKLMGVKFDRTITV